MNNSENNIMNMSNSLEKEISRKGELEEFDIRLTEAANKFISEDELDIYWRTELYGRQVVRNTLMLDKWVRDKFSEANVAMMHFAEFVLKVKEDNIYEQLGYPKFEDWIQNHGISMSTVDGWGKVYDVYIKGYGFKPVEIANYDIKKLKIILPLAELETITKERIFELFDLILYMSESDLRLSVKEEIALTLAEAVSDPQI